MGSFLLGSKYPRTSARLCVSWELDRISKLPDDILIQILDKLPLDEAIATSIISKRWRGLWKKKTRIEIGYQWFRKTGKKALPSLSKYFSLSGQNPIQSVSLSFLYYDSMLDLVQTLIKSASSKNVQELYVDFNDANDNRLWRKRKRPTVLMPESETSPFVKLGLRSLLLKTLPPSCFKALKQLFLEEVNLNEDSLTSITFNCPLLTLLSLVHCNQTTDLRIIISADSSKLHLVINETWVDPRTQIDIKVTGVKSIDFVSALHRRKYCIEGVLICSDSATFQLDQMFCFAHSRRFYRSGFRGKQAENFVILLGELKLAKVLTLNSWCIQVLAVEIKKLSRPPKFNATELVLQTGLTKWEFVGISYMLLGCYKLKRLVVDMAAAQEINFQQMERWKICGPTVKYYNILPDLEIVEFRNHAGDYTWEGDDFQELPFFTGFGYGSLLLWNLKVYANHLTKIVFTTRRQVYETDDIQRFGDSEPYKQFEFRKFPYM